MQPIPFSMIGGGWRAEFFLRVAQALPERFRVVGVAVRDPERRAEIESRFHVRGYDSAKALLREEPGQFVVPCVPRKVMPDMIALAREADVPVLCETPPADGLDNLAALWRDHKDAPVQVAEQYPFQPHHAARLALIHEGRLGRPHYAHVSVAHGYHAMALARQALGIGFTCPTVRGKRFTSPLVQGPSRAGAPTEEVVAQATQELISYDFGDKLALYDFCGQQYMSYIWQRRMIVRGDRGELDTDRVHYLRDYATPLTIDLKRDHSGIDGDLQGHALNGITAGDQWVYRNPLAPGRLSDDEIAVGTCLLRMSRYVRDGEAFYGLADACHDAYLELLGAQAIQTGQPVTGEPQPWFDG